MDHSIRTYNDSQLPGDRDICIRLSEEITRYFPEAESKIWHAHPVWFLNGNPIVGYHKLKNCVRLLFWSGAAFDEEQLQPGSGKFMDASIRYTHANQVNAEDLVRWIGKARDIQWDYKNLVKRKGVLERLK